MPPHLARVSLVFALFAWPLACDGESKSDPVASGGGGEAAEPGDEGKTKADGEGAAPAGEDTPDPASAPATSTKGLDNFFGGKGCIASPDFIEATLALPAGSAAPENVRPDSDVCSFKVTLADGSASTMVFSRTKQSQKQVNQTIDSYTKKPSGMMPASVHPASGTHIMNHKPQGYIMVGHRDFDNLIKITYGGMLAKDLSKEQRPARRDNGVKLATALLDAAQAG